MTAYHCVVEKEIKHILKDILSTSINKPTMVGEYVIERILKVHNACLYFDSVDNSLHVLVPAKNEVRNRRAIMLLLTELISNITELERHHVVLIEPTNIENFLFYNHAKDFFCITPDIYKIGDSLSIRKGKGTYSIYKKDIKILYGDQCCWKMDKLLAILNSYVFPTKALENFIKQGYKSEELYISNRSVRVGYVGVFVAIIIAIVSPIIATKWSNEYGVTKLDSRQYEGLIKAVSTHQVRSNHRNGVHMMNDSNRLSNDYKKQKSN